jgi:hypothetical protein
MRDPYIAGINAVAEALALELFDDDVTAWELRVARLAVCALLAAGWTPTEDR